MPVEIDHANPPRLSPPEALGIDAVSDYYMMIAQIREICRDRWAIIGAPPTPLWIDTKADKSLEPHTD